MLTAIVDNLGVGKVEHRSMPHWDDFWSHGELPWEVAKYFIITRRPDISVCSAYAQGHGDPDLLNPDGTYHWGHLDHRLTTHELMDWWWKAMEHLARLPDAHWFSYEAIVADPEQQIRNIASILNVPYVPPPFKIGDANAKWLKGEQQS